MPGVDVPVDDGDRARAGRLDLTGIVLDKAVLDAGRESHAIALSE